MMPVAGWLAGVLLLTTTATACGGNDSGDASVKSAAITYYESDQSTTGGVAVGRMHVVGDRAAIEIQDSANPPEGGGPIVVLMAKQNGVWKGLDVGTYGDDLNDLNAFAPVCAQADRPSDVDPCEWRGSG